RLPGQPYHYAGNLCTTNWKSKVSVQYHSVLDAFTIIKAKVPKDWKDGPIMCAFVLVDQQRYVVLVPFFMQWPFMQCRADSFEWSWPQTENSNKKVSGETTTYKAEENP
ncbi:hypothetical protein CVT26_004841, partial [Gymnopilus dilepis]